MDIKELELRIKEASEAYYAGEPIMSDEEFDALVNEYNNLTKDTKYKGNNIDSVGFGYVPRNKKYKHKIPVGSLPKLQESDDLTIRFSGDVQISLKLDGLTLVMYYNHFGDLEAIVTRGNGLYGVDVTDRLKSNKYIEKCFLPDSIVRGELLITKSDFERLLFKRYANPRAAVTGILFTKDSNEYDDLLRVIDFQYIDSSGLEVDYQSDKWWGSYLINIVPYKDIDIKTIDLKSILDWKNESDYPTDGIVIKDGFTSNRYALKFETKRREAIVDHIEWNISEKGRYIPVVVFKDKIDLYGSKVGRASAFNYEYVRSHNLGKDSRILVTKANEIIPYIIGVSTEGTIDIPSKCQFCGSELIVEGVHIVCNNTRCSNIIKSTLYNFIMTHYYIDGLGYKLIDKFLTHKNIRNLGDLSRFIANVDLEDKWKDFGSVEGIGSSKIELLKTALVWKRLDIMKLLGSLNIPNLGGVNARLYTKHIRDLLRESVIPVYPRVNYKVIENMKKYRELIIEAVVNFDWSDVDELIVKDYKYKIAITGKISVPRKEFYEFCYRNNIEVVEYIDSTVKYLITENPNSGSSKNKKADELNIIKITEKEFREKEQKL